MELTAAPGQGAGGSLYRHLDLEYVGGSVAGSTRCTYESGGRSWRTFGRLMGYQEYLESSYSESSKAWALIDFASWCCVSEGNLANIISEKFAAVQYLHRLKEGVELPITVPVVQCALKGIVRSHVAAGTPRRVRLTVSFGMLFDGGNSHPLMGSGGEGVVDVFVSELFSTGTIGRDVRCRFRGGALGALPDAG